jgi:DNA-binding NarL/FixJ family response regulator
VSSETCGGPAIRVLIGADDLRFACTLQALLESQGGVEVVAVAHDGADAVALAAQQLPDVVLLDMHLPPTDGIEASRRLREADVSAPVVLLLDDEPVADVVAHRDSGVRAYVRKTDAYATLRDVFRELLLLSPAPL